MDELTEPGSSPAMVVTMDTSTFSSEPQSVRDESSPAPRAVSEQVSSSRPWSTNSAAVSFLDEAFQHHDIDTPEEADTSAFAATEWTSRGTHEAVREAGASVASLPRSLSQQRIRSISRQHGAMSAAQRDFLSVLPPTAPMALLVNVYFEKIHWFMMIFFTSEFRARVQELHTTTAQGGLPRKANPGLLGLVLAVCLTSLRYASPEQNTQLTELGVDPESLQETILGTLKVRFLDVVSLGSIEAVQMCILLGSFYLYHGEPELAWPICGSGLRIAQALKLHQRYKDEDQPSTVPDVDNPIHRAAETRKRCWWAIYEIETFCSMLYGFPLSIVDEDCNVDVPEQYPLRSKDASWESIRWKSTGKATVLSYKVSMAQLSVIVKRALSELYGNRKQTNGNELGARTEGPLVQRLINTVTSLDQQIRQWHDYLPQELRLKEGNRLQQDARPANWAGGSKLSLGPEHHQHTFRIQALALKLAYENARILVHRPLLAYRAMKKINTAGGSDFRSIGENDPLQSSVRSCRDAALQIANIGCTPHFKEVIDTYALSFVALHLFTAGVTLSIMTGLDPLSREAYDSKMGLRKLMEMHSQLKSKSVVAEQGLNILTKLMKLVMTKELERMLHLDVPPQTEPNRKGRDNESSGSLNAVEVTARGTEITTIGPSSNIDHNALQQCTPAADTVDDATASLSFSEDPIITQALSEFEQIMMYDINGVGEEDPVEFSEYLTESCFGRQDQGWIWNQGHSFAS
ncbi:fungal-specific transcription factor domain-containing protein [Colletotrichum godetiae]|uniref:Fungal-specific transcription factor domain-containing protein n=1 Tax=Colletotrichum godetiae TaxID=1209918 RepID=A0AAJ0ETU4_9PEZI|nr:fungal-specific transcription factor domain-containing protein [Colletotrichum godetiae]KAK1675412.1 fungal-specific transcription factor domain-containing protein [Colletotrichum godetiae]